MHKLTLLLLAAVLVTPASATVIVRWAFNVTGAVNVADTATGTNAVDLVTGTPTFGRFGGPVSTYGQSGDTLTGSDPATGTADRVMALSTFGNDTVLSGSRGAELKANTSGWFDPTLTFDSLVTPTSSRYWIVTYTLDGTNWNNTFTGTMTTTAPGLTAGTRNSNTGILDLSHLTSAATNPTWMRTTLSFAGIGATDNNPNFGVRIAAYRSGSTYTAAKTGSTYNGGGILFDWATLDATDVPEPSTLALAGIGGIAVLLARVRRRQRN